MQKQPFNDPSAPDLNNNSDFEINHPEKNNQMKQNIGHDQKLEGYHFIEDSRQFESSNVEDFFENPEPIGDKTPIPSQLPQRPQIENLPEHILRSGAVEALSRQNEDLMARLSVALKRHSLLEGEIDERSKNQRILEHRVSNYKDQLAVLKAKEDNVGGRISKAENEAKQAQQQLRLLEVQYAEYYSTSRNRIETLTQRINSLSKRISRLSKYRKSISQVAYRLRSHLRQTEGQLAEQDLNYNQMKGHLKEAIEHIQNQKKEAEFNQNRLVENYEQQVSTLRDQITEQQSELGRFSDRAKQADEFYQKTVSLENQLIGEKRRHENWTLSKNEEIRTLQEQLGQFRVDSKNKTAALEHCTRELHEIKKENSELTGENNKLQEQVESLQALWRENQREVKKLTESKASLQKLNQQLSVKFNESRAEGTELKDKIAKMQFITEDKISAIKGEISQINSESNHAETSKDQCSEKNQQAKEIEKLLNDIQAGL